MIWTNKDKEGMLSVNFAKQNRFIELKNGFLDQYDGIIALIYKN
jgi:hypothetical protein